VYVSITCPHCNNAFTEVAKDSLYSNKASVCLAHLRGDSAANPPVPPCAAAAAAGVVVAPKRKRATLAAEVPAAAQPPSIEPSIGRHVETSDGSSVQERHIVSLSENTATMSDPDKAALVPSLHAKCREEIEAWRKITRDSCLRFELWRINTIP